MSLEPSQEYSTLGPPPKTGFWFEPSGSEALGGILKPGGWQLAPQLDGIEEHTEGINICYYKIGFDLILDLHAIPATMALLITKRPMVSDPCLLHAKPLTIMNRNGHLSCYILSNSFPKEHCRWMQMGCLTCSFRSVISNGKPKDPPFRRNGALRLKGLISWSILLSGFHDKEMPSSSWIVDDYSDASTLYQYKKGWLDTIWHDPTVWRKQRDELLCHDDMKNDMRMWPWYGSCWSWTAGITEGYW